MDRSVQVPNRSEWLWTFLPWGFGLTVIATGALAAGEYRTAMVVVAADLGNAAFMVHIRRRNRASFLRKHGDQLSIRCRSRDREVALEDVSFVDWLPGNGSPMWSATATPPEVKVTLKSGEVICVEVFFAKRWRESRSKSSLREALAPDVVLRG